MTDEHAEKITLTRGRSETIQHFTGNKVVTGTHDGEAFGLEDVLVYPLLKNGSLKEKHKSGYRLRRHKAKNELEIGGSMNCKELLAPAFT